MCFSLAGGHGHHGGDGGGVVAVCIVHGLHESLTKPDDLAALFAVYGNVQRVLTHSKNLISRTKHFSNILQ